MKKVEKLKGGNGKMAPQQGARPAKPGATSTSKAGKTPWGIKGGNGKMFGHMGAGPQKPGQTAPGGAMSGGKGFPSGGKTKMFGKQCAGPARVA